MEDNNESGLLPHLYISSFHKYLQLTRDSEHAQIVYPASCLDVALFLISYTEFEQKHKKYKKRQCSSI